MLLLPAMVLCSCNQNKQDDEVAIAVTLRGDTIQIGDKSPILSRLKTDVVKKEPYRLEFSTSGVVKAIPSIMPRLLPLLPDVSPNHRTVGAEDDARKSGL